MATHLVGWVRGGLGAWEDNKWERMHGVALGRAGEGGLGRGRITKGSSCLMTHLVGRGRGELGRGRITKGSSCMATHLVGTCAGEVEGSARSVFVVSRTYLLFFQGVTIFRISLRRVNADADLLSRRLDLGRILFCCVAWSTAGAAALRCKEAMDGGHGAAPTHLAGSCAGKVEESGRSVSVELKA